MIQYSNHKNITTYPVTIDSKHRKQLTFPGHTFKDGVEIAGEELHYLKEGETAFFKCSVIPPSSLRVSGWRCGCGTRAPLIGNQRQELK